MLSELIDQIVEKAKEQDIWYTKGELSQSGGQRTVMLIQGRQFIPENNLGRIVKHLDDRSQEWVENREELESQFYYLIKENGKVIPGYLIPESQKKPKTKRFIKAYGLLISGSNYFHPSDPLCSEHEGISCSDKGEITFKIKDQIYKVTQDAVQRFIDVSKRSPERTLSSLSSGPLRNGIKRLYRQVKASRPIAICGLESVKRYSFRQVREFLFIFEGDTLTDCYSSNACEWRPIPQIH